ncbi:MAG: MBL fold metallo-hydrolase, partial [Rubrobacter sp.]|nr:MBL fold metallo-hydrolase [Rubrobacter sp.]
MRRFRVRPGLDGKLAGVDGWRGRGAGAMGVISGIDGLRVGERALAFWGLGQVGVAIKGPRGVLYVDPYLTDSDGEGGSLERTFPPPLRPDEVTNANAVLLTHDHIDHTDPETVLPLSEASTQA